MTQPNAPDSFEIDLESLVARYGRKLAQAELDAEVASQRARRAEARVEELETHVAALASRLDDLESEPDTEEPDHA